ncbi:isoprenyl transferase [Polycladidibacter stylochi]|uniref:isoprenyl transferase n=1 Tax=Polycladidibacter stylochi TaxID=1807766 RepID=UPI00083465EA|nr:isoprenyl transferase [Pseudovibrio stylochi]
MAEPAELLAEPVSECEKEGLPRHVAVIMDGNGRWAQSKGLPRTEGHRRGVQVVRDSVAHAQKRGIEFLTIFGFSCENWRRPEKEVQFLLGLMKLFIESDLQKLKKANVRVRIIGDRHDLPKDLLGLLERAEAKTAECTGLRLQVAFNYGGRQEIVRAVQALARDVSMGRVALDAIGETEIIQYLDTGDIPDPDLIIRTSGEQRISNFLLWQLAYAELYFAPEPWPEFNADAFDRALLSFSKRKRRFGGLDEEQSDNT